MGNGKSMIVNLLFQLECWKMNRYNIWLTGLKTVTSSVYPIQQHSPNWFYHSTSNTTTGKALSDSWTVSWPLFFLGDDDTNFGCLLVYGFHKVNDMIHSNLTSECQKWEFRHQNFRRGAIEELQNIKRKSAKSHHQYLPSSMAASPVSTSSMGRLLLGGHSNQQQSQPYQHPSMQKHIGASSSQIDNKLAISTSTDKLHSNTLCQQVMRMEDRMNKISQSHDSLKTETNELRTILSRQHIVSKAVAQEDPMTHCTLHCITVTYTMHCIL